MQLRILVVAFVIGGCGKPTLQSVDRHQATVEANQVTEPDVHGERHVELVVHRDDCPADRTRMRAWADGGVNAACLRGLAVGSHIEIVRAVYKHRPLSTGVREGDPKSAIGGCSVRGVSFEQIGTPCP